MIIRSKTFKDWMRANFDRSTLEDMVNYGVDGGFYGLIYYRDTVKLFDKFRDEIIDAAYDDSEEMGYDNIYEFFACFNKSHMPGGFDQMANQLVWYMAERTARELTE